MLETPPLVGTDSDDSLSPAIFAPAATPRDPVIAEVKPQPASKLPKWLRLPNGVSWTEVRWAVTLTIAGLHAAALLAVLPYFFSWTGVIVAVAGVYVFGTLGINICYHRLLTHRSFKAPVWLERTFALLALCCLEGSPPSWVANHRMHHQHSDHEPDPHSPVVAFLWSHVGWMLVENRDVNDMSTMTRYARDIFQDPFYYALTKKNLWLLAYPLHAALFFLAGFGIGYAWDGTAAAGLQLGLSWVVWGVLVRTILVWHITWSVNSLTHLWGYRNYETNENSRNNWIVGLLANGEGWHNNHHADQRSAAHGHRWYEFDVTYITIVMLKWMGLASNIIKPKKVPGHGH